MKFKKIYLITFILTFILSGCVETKSRHNIEGEGLIDFEIYSNNISPSDGDCLSFGGVAANSSNFKAIKNVKHINSASGKFEDKRFLELTEKSFFVVNKETNKYYECIPYGTIGFFSFLNIKKCCFDVTPNLSLEEVENLKDSAENVKQYLENLNRELNITEKYLEQETKFKKILDSPPLEPWKAPRVPSLPTTISSSSMELINKINKCIEAGKKYDRTSQECK